MEAHIIIGLGYGDEGKGMVTAATVRGELMEGKKPLVVRFNGGHQAGHTVVKDGFRHTFSSFGSGTLHGAPTFWSKYCTIYPLAIINEYHLIRDMGLGLRPVLYIDPMCPVTTRLDVAINQDQSLSGTTVGVGFGRTIERTEKHYTLYAKDLQYPKVVEQKMLMIAKYYESTEHNLTYRKEALDDIIAEQLQFNKWMLRLDGVSIGKSELYTHRDCLIFEGAQGVLLDQDFGFFPYVTRSHTTSRNARAILKEMRIAPTLTTYMVTRSYQTRHGMGPLTLENYLLPLINNEKETNKENKFQGSFRKGEFDPEMVNYAISCEETNGLGQRHIFMTCCDQKQPPEWKHDRYAMHYCYDAEGLTFTKTPKHLINETIS